jgi:hypothetical protein
MSYDRQIIIPDNNEEIKRRRKNPKLNIRTRITPLRPTISPSSRMDIITTTPIPAMMVVGVINNCKFLEKSLLGMRVTTMNHVQTASLTTRV